MTARRPIRSQAVPDPMFDIEDAGEFQRWPTHAEVERGHASDEAARAEARAAALVAKQGGHSVPPGDDIEDDIELPLTDAERAAIEKLIALMHEYGAQMVSELVDRLRGRS